MSSRCKRASRDTDRVESSLANGFNQLDMSSTSLSEPRGRDPRPLRATASTPALTEIRTRSRSRDSIYAGKQLHRTHSPDAHAKPGRPAIRFPPNFEFVDNSYTPSISALELASSSSQHTARSSTEHLGEEERSSAAGSPPSSPRPLEMAQTHSAAPLPKRHPASVPAKVSRPKSPNPPGPTPVSPIHEEGDVPDTLATPKQTAFEMGPRQHVPNAPVHRPHARPAAEAALPRPAGPSQDTLSSGDGPEDEASPDRATMEVNRAVERAQERENEGSGGRSILQRWHRTSSEPQKDQDRDQDQDHGRDQDRDRGQKQEEATASGGVGANMLRRASTLLHHGIAANTQSHDAATLAEDEEDSGWRWNKSVGFDTMPDALDTASETFSFTLQAKTKGYQRSKNTRIFMCAVDNNLYSETALAWCMEQLVEDGDELVAVRVVEGEKEDLDQDLIREHAHDLMDQIAEMNDEVPGRRVRTCSSSWSLLAARYDCDKVLTHTRTRAHPPSPPAPHSTSRSRLSLNLCMGADPRQRSCE